MWDSVPFRSTSTQVLGITIALVGGYVYGLRRLGPRLSPTTEQAVTGRQIAWFASGVALYFLFEAWPLHDIAERSLYSVHMVQHLLLAFVVPPALLKGTPSWLLRYLVRPVLPVLRLLTRPLVALLVFNAALAWLHAPGVVAGMLDNAFFHAAAHAIVVGGAFLMWWPVLGPIPDLRLSPPAAIGYLFLQSLVPLIRVVPDVCYGTGVRRLCRPASTLGDRRAHGSADRRPDHEDRRGSRAVAGDRGDLVHLGERGGTCLQPGSPHDQDREGDSLWP